MEFRNRLMINNIVKIYLLLVVIVFTTCLTYVYLFQEYASFIFNEDALIENLTAGTYFATFILSNFLMANDYGRKKILVTTSIVSLLLFLEEISYGGKLFKSGFPL